jgi:hypothetical protein
MNEVPKNEIMNEKEGGFEKELQTFIDWRESRYAENLKENPERFSMKSSLEKHNDIVFSYAEELSEKMGLHGEDKIAALVGTIMHDSGKLNTEILNHHVEGRKYTLEMLESMQGQNINGIVINREFIEKVANAVYRHMNHPYLIRVNGGEKFPEPENSIDMVVNDADMLANIGFKNVAFGLMDKQGMDLYGEMAKKRSVSLIQIIFEVVVKDINSLSGSIYSPEGKEKSFDLMEITRKIFENMKNRNVFSGFDSSEIDKINLEKIEQIKMRLNEQIKISARELDIREEITDKLLI